MIDELGGMVEAIEAGFPQREIMDAAYAYQRAVDTNEKIVVGVNEFVEEDEKPIETLCDEAQFFLKFAGGTDLRSFTVCKRPRGRFKQITNGGVPVLPDKDHRAVLEDRNDHSTAVVMNDFALVRQLTFADRIDGDFEDAAVENLLTVEYLW